MKHYIISKFKPGFDLNASLADIKSIFNKLTQIEGIHAVEYKLNCISRDNRYNLMIIIDMEKEALSLYDSSVPHKEWKEKYGSLLESKAIFDSEE